MKNQYLLFTCVCLILASCSSSENKDVKSEDTRPVYSLNVVDTLVLLEKKFHLELISNGRLRAFQKSDLSFETLGIVELLMVKNGEWVKQGDLIARLDVKDAELKLRQSVQLLEKATIALKDALLGFGFMLSDSAIIPAQTLSIAKVRSGYNDAILSREFAVMELEKRSIRAPFNGKIANLTTKIHEKPKGEYFCTLINDKTLDVEFSLIESEMALVHKEQKIKVSTFFKPNFYHYGKITVVNPSVGNNGQISIYANIPNSGDLVDGMSVKIYVEKEIPNCFVVPKSAVLVRDNREMLFVYNNGKAQWIYVTILHSNSHSHVVIPNTERQGKLKKGDIVIISGNLNLGDGSEVKISK